MAEHLTATALRERLDLERAEFDRLTRAQLWPKVRTKSGERYPWPKALHAYVAERERLARAELPELVSGEQLGELINRTTRTLHNYQKAGIPYQVEGKAVRYPLVAALRWCIDTFTAEHKQGADGKPPTVAAQKEHEDLLKARSQRMQAEIDLAERQGRIVTIEFMRREFEETMAALRDVLLNLPGDLADQVLGVPTKAKVRALIRAHVDKMMTTLRDALTRVAERETSALDDAEVPDGDDDADESDDDADDAS